MTDKEKRQKLVRFLDDKAFDPILHKSANDYSGKQRQKFEDVKRSTANEKKRFHDKYGTAEEVKRNYLSDLSSRTAKKKQKELDELRLPTLPEFRDEFLELCKKLGVQ
jgi:hypothetical protein